MQWQSPSRRNGDADTIRIRRLDRADAYDRFFGQDRDEEAFLPSIAQPLQNTVDARCAAPIVQGGRDPNQAQARAPAKRCLVAIGKTRLLQSSEQSVARSRGQAG